MTQMDQDDPHTPPKQKQQTFTSGDDDKDDVNYFIVGTPVRDDQTGKITGCKGKLGICQDDSPSK